MALLYKLEGRWSDPAGVVGYFYDIISHYAPGVKSASK